jgi:hypothetical protein
MPSLLAFAFFVGLFVLASRGARADRAARVFVLESGKRYRFQVEVAPPFTESNRAAFRSTLEASGFSDINLTTRGNVTAAAYTAPPQAVTMQVTEGQTLLAIAGHSLKLETVREA